MQADHGVNFFDTAEMYPVPNRAETVGRTEAYIGSWLAVGRTEAYIGSWLARRKSREKIILATKVAGPANMAMPRDGAPGLDAANIRLAVDASLGRLCIAPGSLDTSLSHAAGLSDIAVCHA